MRRAKTHFQTLRYNLIWQPILCMAFLFCVLWALNSSANSLLLWAAGASSLASSAYIIFVLPNGHSAKAYRVIGAYVISAVIAMLLVFLFKEGFHLMGDDYLSATFPHVYWICAVLSVGISMFLMVIFDFQHPPAAGIGMVMVLDIHNYHVIFVILGAAIVLSVLKYALRNQLKNLI